MDSITSLLFSKLPGVLRLNYPLNKTNWFNVGGTTKYFYKPLNTQDLAEIINIAYINQINILPLGVGSNILIRDGGFDGLVIKLGKEFNYIQASEDLIEIGASVLDQNVAAWTLNQSFKGFEFLSGIPGTIGGALAMNAGCYGAEIKDILVKAEIVNHSGQVQMLYNEDLRYTYRKHGLNFKPYFTRGWFKAIKGEQEAIKLKMDHITKQREQTQPLRSKTGGSTFKNPDPSICSLKAWELLDKVGMRGFEHHGAKFSDVHCNFLINFNNASATAIEELGEIAKKRVFEQFGIELTWEIERVGTK
ncbi:UDP-N-acetylmuramate dehydrogenase [Rickettsiales endosymbiont of Stachyamoeba lipophora]|uniref:UDP-N-acetylmuramate dehydrogenase n=1 Tax=Rickettsiales endosymbiont of Stachyamoeba lipophora TaxID=2486578 RepID=UPI000F652E73|nr:UDP-N-acetylmuramate dehydrogenase [Rickettsiales endosymbiont of Stachyamoeba lipophora]AZL15463.1 UDP-N-acetylmuramate dehydrogenase [Rickettsiales endosymbiont of Stachyamoeba lipophora]